MTDSSGALIHATNYDPYAPGTSNLGFTGEYTDPSGLQYLRARYYDPTTAMFLSTDPVQGIVGGQSIRFNPYIYAGANPTNYVDPSGECFFFGIDTAICLFGLGLALDAGSQMAFEGRSWEEINWTRAALSGATTVIGGGVGFVSGSLIRTAGFTGARALAAGGIAATVDFGVGVAADHYLLGDDWGTAVFGNVLGFGIGEVAGYGFKSVARGIGAGLRSANNNIQRLAHNLDLNAVTSGGLPILRNRYGVSGPRSFREAYEIARSAAGIPKGAIPVARVNLYYEASASRIRSLSNETGLTFNAMRDRLAESTRLIKQKYQLWGWGRNPNRLRTPTSDPGAVGSIHIFETGKGLRAIVHHHTDFAGNYGPHVHAARPLRDNISSTTWAEALAGLNVGDVVSDKYRAIVPPGFGDHHIDYNYQIDW